MFSRRELILGAGGATVAALGHGLAAAQTSTAPAPIPVETLFRKSAYRNVRLSPDGKWLAATVSSMNRQNLVVLDVVKQVPTLLTRFEKADVNTVFWAGNDRLIYTTGDQQGLEFRGDGGLFAINKDGSDARILVEPLVTDATGAKESIRFVARRTRVLRRIKGSTDEVLVSANDRDVESQDIYRMNIFNGRKSLLSFDSPGLVFNWVVDESLKPRAALCMDFKGKRWSTVVRSVDGKEWVEIARWNEQLEKVIIPYAFDPSDSSNLYVRSNVGRDTLAYFKFDTKTMKLGEVVAGTARFDFGSFELIPDEEDDSSSLLFGGDDDAPGQLIGLRADLDRTTTVWFDEKSAKLQRTVDAALPNAVNTFDPSRKRALVFSRSPTNPGAYYWFDSEKNTLEDTGLRTRPWIDPAQMAPMQYVSWTARDGMKIDGYLTLPRTYKKGSPVPFILHPHGGPWARDEWRFNPEVQFMANRGYAVLQPNFRGSTGYGAKHLKACYKQWGGSMIDDMLDGVQWAIDQGYADAKRLGVYGASYGGYATLMALVKRPDWFKWGINYVGVTDMFVHQDTQPAQLRGDFYELAKSINGDQKSDRKMFEATSPTRQIARISVPVFHAYGGVDRNVDFANGIAIKAAFDKAGKPYEWMFVPDEAHGYRQDKNSFEFYQRFDKFMEAHTPKAS